MAINIINKSKFLNQSNNIFGDLVRDTTEQNFLSGNTTVGISEDTILSNQLYLRISTNESEFTTLIDGEPTGNNKFITLSKLSFARNPTKVEVTKNGYVSNEYYLIEMLDDGVPIINNPNVYEPLGLTTKELYLRKFKDGKFISSTKLSSNNLLLEFDLYEAGNDSDTSTEYTAEFNISGEGAPISILKNNMTSAEFFPPIGTNTYVDVSQTKYLIRSSDLELYRITNIVVNTENNQSQVFNARPDESLEIKVELNGNYSFNITTERVIKPDDLPNPLVSLVNPNSRKYNINSKEGVPLMFRKNNDVEVITVIIGDDILEFDELGSSETCGIIIPHDSFDKIGKYNIKVFPFSFDDYENQLNNTPQQTTIDSKKIDIKFTTKEEPVPIPPTPPANTYNPYIRGGSGDQRFDNPFIGLDPISGTNNGSFVNNPITRIRIR